MFKLGVAKKLEDYFIPIEKRRGEVYFYRIGEYSLNVATFLRRYFDEARKNGVLIIDKIGNPTEQNLSYYNEMLGLNFLFDINFILNNLKKWLPRMKDESRKFVGEAMYDILTDLKRSGKSDSILKNVYIKFMCWFYYKFERIVNQLGEGNLPKILYDGEVNSHELMMLSILSKAGCDIIILETKGDSYYLQVDKTLNKSFLWKEDKPLSFPNGYGIKYIQEEIKEESRKMLIYGILPKKNNCTNAWISGNAIKDIELNVSQRGNDDRFYYNAFIRVNGVWDRNSYVQDISDFRLKLKNSGRNELCISKTISLPTTDEISRIKRKNYDNLANMLADLSANLHDIANQELQRLVVKAFLDIMFEEAKNLNNNLNKIVNKAVYLLCYIKRYVHKLFIDWVYPKVECFIRIGVVKDDNETLFIRFLSRLPVDVLILCPNGDNANVLKDNLLFDENYEEKVDIPVTGDGRFKNVTVAYQAERELDSLLYQDSGIYRDMQYQKANVITLSTMYEEIKLLWKEELKYRQGFATSDVNEGVVTIPTIFAKISGVKDGKVLDYWQYIKDLNTDNAFLISNAPFISAGSPNPIKAFATQFYERGRILKNKIKSHKCYTYEFLREEVQEHILDKLQLLIDKRFISGTGQNGTEYTIIATILSLPKEILRLIQSFDFTKVNPKLIYINTREEFISLEDSIMIAFLHLIGFDIVFFVPTGYQNIEKYFAVKMFEEYKIGEFIYDLNTPDLRNVVKKNRTSLRELLFGKGGN